MRDEVARLLEKAERNIGFAQSLLRDGGVEIAASRAYYAMFYVAEALLLERGLAFSKHAAVIARYGEQYARTGALDPAYHRHLMEAFRTRQIADYDTVPDIATEDARLHIDRAREFLAAAREHLERETEAP